MGLMLGYPDDLFRSKWPVPSVAGIAAEWHPSALSLSCKLSSAQDPFCTRPVSLFKASFHSVTARRSNLSTLNKINPEYSLERLMLKLQYFGHLMRTAHSLEKTLMLGKIEGRRRRGQQRMSGWMASLTQWTWVRVGSRSWWLTGKPGMLYIVPGVVKSQTWLNNLIELNWKKINCAFGNFISIEKKKEGPNLEGKIYSNQE